jgi:hypothetical protein
MRIHSSIILVPMLVAAAQLYACGEDSSDTVEEIDEITSSLSVLDHGRAFRTPNGRKCLDVPSGQTANGTRPQIWDCTGARNQDWVTTQGGTLRHSASGRCLDVIGGTVANGGQLQIWDCNGSAQQAWALTSSEQLRNGKSGRCLDVTGASSTNGGSLQIWDCNGNAQQHWVPQYFNLVNGNFNVSASANANGSPLLTGTPLIPIGWSLTVRGELFEFTSGRCADVRGASTTNGTRVQLWDCNGSVQQKWTWFDDSTLRTIGGKCLDVAAPATAADTPLQIWDCLGTSNQKFQTASLVSGVP